MILLGTCLNGMGILVGGVAGRVMRRPLDPSTQGNLRTGLGIILVFAGLHLTWSHFGGGFLTVLKQFGIVMISMSLGNLIGKITRLQKTSNRLGKFSAATLDRVSRDHRAPFNDGFTTCAILFCIAPLSILGAVQAGLSDDWRAFGVKAVVDGLAAMSFVGVFGRAVFASVLPVVAWQGSLTMAVRLAEPWLKEHALIDSIHATGGMLLFCVALLILEIRKVPVADYLPSLLIAPFITFYWR